MEPNVNDAFKIYAILIDESNEMVADQLSVDLALNGDCIELVKFNLSQKTSEPGKSVQMTIDSLPNSMCYMSAIDRALTFSAEEQNHLKLSTLFSIQQFVRESLPDSKKLLENFKMGRIVFYNHKYAPEQINPINLFKVIKNIEKKIFISFN